MATINLKQRLTAKMERELVSALQNGQSLKGACEFVYFSYARACALMREESSKGRKFLALVNRAQAVAENRLVTRLMETGSPRECLQFLQARFSEWDKAKNVKGESDNLKASALLARLQTIPEQIKKRN